jgi:hypothetical protein
MLRRYCEFTKKTAANVYFVILAALLALPPCFWDLRSRTMHFSDFPLLSSGFAEEPIKKINIFKEFFFKNAFYCSTFTLAKVSNSGRSTKRMNAICEVDFVTRSGSMCGAQGKPFLFSTSDYFNCRYSNESLRYELRPQSCKYLKEIFL